MMTKSAKEASRAGDHSPLLSVAQTASIKALRHRSDEIYKQELHHEAGVKYPVNDRAVVPIANLKRELSKQDRLAAAMELPDGTIVTGSTSDLLGPASAVLLNATQSS